MKELDVKILEGNKLLAIFDGYQESDCDLMILSAVSFKMAEGYPEEYAKQNYDLYHNCWKYLIPMCQKIKNVTIEENMDLDIPQVKDLQIAILNLDISQIHTACVSFVKYFNKKKDDKFFEDSTSA
jgi:hypothetical protein